MRGVVYSIPKTHSPGGKLRYKLYSTSG